METPKIWHVALISFYKNTPEAVRKEIYDRYQTLAEDCGGKDAGILYWEVGSNLDPRKGDHLVEISIFENDDALQRFRIHPKHKELTDILRGVADWRVGDIFKT